MIKLPLYLFRYNQAQIAGQITLTPNRTYQAFVTLQPDWLPFNWLGTDVVNKRKYKTGKVSDLPHLILLNMLYYTGPHFYFT